MSTRLSGEVGKEKLMQDLRAVVADAEELLRATAGQAGDKAASARERIQGSLNVAKERLVDAEQEMVEKARQAARMTDEYVHENPWRAAGAAAGIGLIIGMLISRGR